MDYRRYVFVGNREYVLKEMMEKDLNIVSVWVMKDSFLNKVLQSDSFTDYEVISNKEQLLKLIDATSFDVLVSNGNKYILPISNLKPACYVNIHPSNLPDLRGKDPINGACLYNRTAGATCHMMDDGIDTGKIISRVEIPMSDDLDAAILYQLSFKAEVIAFRKAYSRNFEILDKQPCMDNPIYYSMQSNDCFIDFSKGFSYLAKQVRAFGYKSHGLYFSCNNINYRFFRMSEVINKFANDLYVNEPEMTVLLSFEDSIVFKYNGRLVRFDGITDRSSIAEGMFLENGIVP